MFRAIILILAFGELFDASEAETSAALAKHERSIRRARSFRSRARLA